ncbi:HEPN domain-containing protein [Paraburkholderia sp. USG1]|uniref:HEPN domain-containing protein n=1 Tax=Paraburkholderia sp. USG1 TaxID=2952268 RepID=UPI00285A290D|nr:HEPN domain-containing protein [Paraburkholderia sp. USG1]MDR8401703.1 HEPN domain-containing protein [Paraburkholderia sp. USG1]
MDEKGTIKFDWGAAIQNAIRYTSTSFVANPMQINSGALPFAFPDGSVLDKATPIERENIKIKLESLIGRGGTLSLTSIFECKQIPTELPGGGHSIQTESLPESEWKYYVVRYPGTRNVNVNLHYAASICEAPLDLLSFSFSEISHGWKSERLQKYFNIGSHPGFAGRFDEINVDSLKEIAITYDLLISATGGIGGKGGFPEILRALQMLDSLNDLPSNSDFVCLGLFAIIEMLTTHNPVLEDRGDSITHQMKSKIPLLSRRFDRPLPLSEYFGDASSEKIWSALYSYRSSVAHGGVPDFRKKLQLLVSQENADKFLRVTVKSLIRHALREPDLYSDLRAC